MSTTATHAPRAARPPRVREQARDAVVLMAFSATTSGVLATCLLLITQLGR